MTSSQPTTAISPGTSRPASWRWLMIARASSSLAQTRASASSSPARMRSATASPSPSRNGTRTGAAGVLGADALDALLGRARDDDDGLLAVQGPGDGGRHGGRAEHGDGVDAGGELAHGASEVGLAVGEHQGDALAELGGPRLEAHEQLGVVGTGELRQHETVCLVVAYGEAAGGAERHVVELLDGVEDLLGRRRRHGAGALGPTSRVSSLSDVSRPGP